MISKEEILEGEDESLFLTSCYFDFEKFYKRVMGMEVMPFHREWIQILKDHKFIAISAPTGFGKCFGEGTEIMMYDYSIKKVEDIKPEDLLMGDDSNPRKVINITRGIDNLYKVTQKNGNSYIVNEPHILSLRMNHHVGGYKKGEIVDISVSDYIKKSKTFKWCAKGFKSIINFSPKEVEIDPYFLGIWLGDGTSADQSISNIDTEIIDFIKDYAIFNLNYSELKHGNKCPRHSIVGIKKKKNILLELLKKYNLINNKHIPDDYKFNSEKVRLNVLAGLIDTDGYTYKNVISISQKSETLSKDIVFLARSLGFRVHIRKIKKGIKSIGFIGYYEIIISGNTDKIPIKITRKKCSLRKINKNPLNTGINIESIGLGDYYGFEIEGNKKRFLLSDFTVVHNTQLFGIGYPIWLAFFKPRSEILIISNTIRSQSANILEEIKITIETNEILRSLIPKDTRTSWTKEKMVMSNLSVIQLCANSKSVRGHHPDYEFCDEVAVYDDHEIFWRDVVTRVDNKKGILACVSTPVNTSDILAQLMNKPKFFSKFYPAMINKEGKADIKGDSIWPTRFPNKYILEEIKGKINLSDFEKNYLCNPKAEAEDPVYTLVSVEDCYDVSRSFSNQTEGGIIYIGCDFAIASGPTADFDAYTVVEYLDEKIILRHGERHRGLPLHAKLQRLRELKQIYNPSMFIMDPSSIGTSIIQQLIMEGFPVESQSFQSIARRKLLVDLKSVIDNKRLIIPRNLEHMETVNFTDKLTEELIGFRDVKSRKTETKYLYSVASHDDTVMSLAMACKGASVLTQTFEDPIGISN